MAQWQKFLDRLLAGQRDANIDFDDLCTLLSRLGFSERISGSHHIFSKAGITSIINIQALSSGKAKPYQVKQTRVILRTNGITHVS